MARPIAYNASGPLSGSIRGGSVNYTIDGAGRDYTTFAGKKWVPSADGAAPIIFVTDSFTRGLTTAANAYPLFFSCAGTGSAAILYTANRLPGSPGNFTDTGSAFYDLTVSYGYFILEGNDPYQGDYGSGNYLTLDASKTTSYPQSSPKFFDLSGNGFTFDLINGPTWDSNGWFAMDGTDDSIFAISPATAIKATKTTLVMWFRTTDTVGLLLSGQPPYAGGAYYVGAWAGGSGFYQSNCGSPTYYIDTEQVSDPLNPVSYNDGRFHMWEAKDLSLGSWTNNWNFGGYDSSYSIIGDIAKIEIYSSSLSPEQSKQNYFGAPIVTDGLVFAVDANNIISYPKSGTSWYGLTGSINGTLINGPTFSPLNGGSIVFDGVDDYVTFSTITNAVYTINFWYQMGGDDGSYGYFASAGDGKGLAISEGGTANGLVYGQFYYYDGSGVNNLSNIPSTVGWNNICVIINTTTSNIQIYGNSVLLTNTTVSNMSTQITDIGRYTLSGNNFLKGKLANYKIYNRALTAAEVQQNYQAEQYRFEGPSGLITNGMVVYLDASNLDSYPGTGNTWYDLTGNSNNATKNGNAANPTWNAGGYFTFAASDGSTGANNIFTIANSATLSNLTDITVQFICAMETKTPVGGDYDWMGIVSKGEEGNQRPGTSVNQLPGNRYYHIETPGGVNSAADLFTNADYTGNKWNMFQTRVSNAGGTQGWLNGTQVATAGNTTAGNTSTTYIGSNGFFELFKGKLGVVCIYNRALSNAELVQNYNYFKGRFGL